MTRRTKAKDLRRKVSTRSELRTVVVFCEGEKSEPDYVEGLKRLPAVSSRTWLRIEVEPDQGVPLTLVQRIADLEIDECWCVFDVEWPKNHPNLPEAVALARRHGVRLAISNPCFELWLILHFKDHTGFINTCDAERVSKRLDGRGGKSINADQYMANRHHAAQRAASLTARHAGNGTSFPHDNPSSTMYELLAAIQAEQPN